MLLMPTVLCAHGINGHVHVTAWSMAEIEEQGVLEILNDLSLTQPYDKEKGVFITVKNKGPKLSPRILVRSNGKGFIGGCQDL